MSQIKLKDIPFNDRYVYLRLDGNLAAESLVANLKHLYWFIDQNEPGVYSWQNGKAFRAILKEARRLAGNRRSYIISKKQVTSLITIFVDKEGGVSVKIPYSADYIFRAIFSVFDKYKQSSSVPISPELVALFGKVRREVFYKEQSDKYEYAVKNDLLNKRDELFDIRKKLVNDLCTGDCTLGKRF